jgi:hypothetical protein
VDDDPPWADAARSRFTTRLRLEPVGLANARDLWLEHNDDEVASCLTAVGLELVGALDLHPVRGDR